MRLSTADYLRLDSAFATKCRTPLSINLHSFAEFLSSASCTAKSSAVFWVEAGCKFRTELPKCLRSMHDPHRQFGTSILACAMLIFGLAQVTWYDFSQGRHSIIQFFAFTWLQLKHVECLSLLCFLQCPQRIRFMLWQVKQSASPLAGYFSWVALFLNIVICTTEPNLNINYKLSHKTESPLKHR